jgi:hypothetical protein
VVKETFVIIVAKIDWNDHTILTHSAGLPRVDANREGHFFRPFQYRVAQSEVADSCLLRVPEMLVDSHSSQLLLQMPLR